LSERAQHPVLDCVHSAPVRCGLVIEAVQVQKAVEQIKFDFTPGRSSKLCGVTLCGLRADKNFAVLKRYDISRARDFVETPMQSGNSPIRNQEDIDARQTG